VQDEAAAATAGTALDGATSEDAGKEQLGRALDESLAEALQQESADLTMALLRSKIDTSPLNLDGVVVWRLTSCSAEIANTIIRSESLAGCRSRVEDAGCEVMPEWACGAILLVPMTAEQVMEANLALKAHNLVGLASDRDLVGAALNNPRRRRPQVKPEHQAYVTSAERLGSEAKEEDAGPSGCRFRPGPASDDAADARMDIFEELGIIEERTFLHCPAAAQNFELPDKSALVQTEPSGGMGTPMRANLRRWRAT